MRILKLLISLSFLFGSLAFAKSDIEFCYDYAEKSVEQNKLNIQQQCGFSGLRWSDDLLGQIQWCMTIRRGIATGENLARQKLLNSCKSNKQTTATDKTSHQAFCMTYAQTAVEQNQKNLKQQCGFTGLRWSNDKQGQREWCLTVSNGIASKETQARKQLLDSCLLKHATPQISASKAVPVQSMVKQVQAFKSPRVQQLFPQKATHKKLQKLGLKDLGELLLNFTTPLFNFSLSHSGRWLAQGTQNSNDSTIKIWDLKQGKLLYIFGEERGIEYFRLSFSPDEKYLVAGNNGIVDIWDWKNARLLHRITDYFLPLGQGLSFDAKQKLYLQGYLRKSVARYDLASGQREALWKFSDKFESSGFAISKKGKIAITQLASKKVILKVFDSYKNKLILEKKIPPFSIYNNKGNYPSGLLLGFIDDENLAFYNLESLGEQAFISRLNLPTKTIETMRLADDSALRMGDFIDAKKIQAGVREKLCPGRLPQLAWKNLDKLKCQLKHQDIQSNYIASSYLINDSDSYYRMNALHNLQGKLIAYFGSKSNARWFWLDAQSGILKNSNAQWGALPNPNRKPNIYHFAKHIVPVEPNKKVLKTYNLPKTDIKRLEVLLGADDTVEFEPNIKPSFGDYALSHNGRWLVAGYALWDLQRHTYVKSFKSKIAWSHRSSMFSPDDNYLVLYYGSTRGHYAPCIECSSVIDIWNIKTSQYEFSIPLLDRNNHTSPPVLFNNGDMYLNVNNKVVQKWNIKQQRFVENFRSAKKLQEVFSITGNGDDLLAISIAKKQKNEFDLEINDISWVEVWSISQHKMINKITISNKPDQGRVKFNSVFVTDRKLAVSSQLNDITIWDAVSGRRIKSLVPPTEYGSSYYLSSEGDGILISSGQYIQRWDITKGKLLMTVNACQPDMPGLPSERYTQLKAYNGFGSAKIAAEKVVSAFSCPQGGRSKVWDMKTGELKALFGKNYKGEWFWLNDKEELKATVPPPS